MSKFSGIEMRYLNLQSVISAMKYAALLMLLVGLGIVIALFPPGFIIRIAAIVIFVGFGVLAWMLRSERAGIPGVGTKILFGLTVFLSVVWPRFIYIPAGGIYVNPFTISVILSLIFSIFWIIYSPSFSRSVFALFFTIPAFAWLLIAWFAWRLLACFAGEYPVVSTFDLVRESIYLASFILIACALLSIDGGGNLLFRILVMAGIFVCSIGLVEGFLQNNWFIKFASGADTQAVSNTLATLAIDKMREGAYRAQSVFEHPIIFAQFVAAVVPVGFYFMFNDKSRFWRFLGAILVPIGILAIAKSGSRAGSVSLVVSIAFLIFIYWFRGFRSTGWGRVVSILAMPLFLVGIAIAYVGISQLAQGRNAVEASSTSTRLFMLTQGVRALSDSPLLGFGQGLAISKAGVKDGASATIDSYLLSIALDSGYVGLALLLSAMAVFVYCAFRACMQDRGVVGSRIGYGAASVLAIFATFAALSIPSSLTLMWLLLFATLASMRNATKWQVVDIKRHTPSRYH